MKERFLHFLSEHYVALLLAFFLTLIIEAPLFAFPFVAKNYQGINIPHYGTDSHFYLSRAKEALEGNKLGNPFLREGKNEQDVYFMHNERVLTFPLRVVGLSEVNPVTLYNTLNTVGVFFLILLIYVLALRLSGNKLFAIVAAITVIGGYHIVYRQFFYTDFNIYGRPTFPLISSLVFFGYLTALTLWLYGRRTLYLIVSTLLFASLFYVYFFAWTFALALNGSLFLCYLWKREWNILKGLAFISGAGTLLGLPNLLAMGKLFGGELAEQVSYFHWSSSTHRPIFSKVGAATLLLFVLFRYRRKDNLHLPLLCSLIAAGWVALNQQIITGRTVEIGHYYWYFIVPLSIIGGLYMLWELFATHRFRRSFFVLLLVGVFAHAILGQYRSFPTTLPGKNYEQLYAPILSALDSLPRGVVLAADDYLAYLITIYTDHDLFWQTAATQTLIPFSRFTDALFVYLYLNREGRDNFSGFLNASMEKRERNLYTNLYRHIEGFTSGLDYYAYTYRAVDSPALIGAHRSQTLSELEALYRAKKQNIGEVFSRYGVTYLLWDKNRHPEWDLSSLTLREVAHYDNIFLYEL